MSSLSLSLYLTLARARTARAQFTPGVPRPEGTLVWLHADTEADARTLTLLATRLQAREPGLRFLSTGTWADIPDLHEDVPPDTIPTARAFMEHWRPDLLLWCGLRLKPALLAATDCPRFLINASIDTYMAPATRILPDPVPATLNVFTRIFADTDEALRLLIKQGVPPSRVEVIGRVAEIDPPPDCPTGAEEKVAARLGPRPLWLAAGLRAREAERIFAAHDAATRFAHRLLLIAVPASEEDRDEIADAAWRSGLRLCFWDQGEEPDDATQVLMIDGPEELGLWYRVSPVSFMGSSLTPGYGGIDPMPAAALGSAMLYGPNVGRHLGAYGRLAERGAARIVRDAGSLASGISQTIAPDTAAGMSVAAWEVVSEGAAAAGRVIETAREAMGQTKDEK